MRHDLRFVFLPIPPWLVVLARDVMLRTIYTITRCGDGETLYLLEVQPPGKKVQDARSFWNGLQSKRK